MTFASRLAGAVLMTLVATSCAGNRDAVLDSSGNRPGWVASDQDTWVEDDKVYFRAFVDRQAKLDLAIDRARNMAKAAVGQAVTSKVLSVFGQNESLVSNDVDSASVGEEGSAIKREILSVSKAANIQGVTPVASYWEKVRTMTRSGEEAIAYKVYAVVYIPKKDLLKAQREAAQEGKRRLQGQLNQKTAQDLERGLRDLMEDGD